MRWTSWRADEIQLAEMGLCWFSNTDILFICGVLVGGGTPSLFLVITLLHASTNTDGLLRKDCGS